MTTSTDWRMINSPTSPQLLSPDPWLTGDFKVGGDNKAKPRTKKDLYEIAKRLKIPGRSSMSKSDLERAIRRKIISGKNK